MPGLPRVRPPIGTFPRTSSHYQRIFYRSFAVYPDRVCGLYRPANELPFMRGIGFSVLEYELLVVADAIYLTSQA
jgi:hypothetical protein